MKLLAAYTRRNAQLKLEWRGDKRGVAPCLQVYLSACLCQPALLGLAPVSTAKRAKVHGMIIPDWKTTTFHSLLCIAAVKFRLRTCIH